MKSFLQCQLSQKSWEKITTISMKVEDHQAFSARKNFHVFNINSFCFMEIWMLGTTEPLLLPCLTWCPAPPLPTLVPCSSPGALLVPWCPVRHQAWPGNHSDLLSAWGPVPQEVPISSAGESERRFTINHVLNPQITIHREGHLTRHLAF